MTEGTYSFVFSGRQRIRNEATECYTSGIWRTRQRYGKVVPATESESQRQDYSGALSDSVTSLVSRDIGNILKLSDEPITGQFNGPNDHGAIQ